MRNVNFGLRTGIQRFKADISHYTDDYSWTISLTNKTCPDLNLFPDRILS